jgi:hypothetical protein
MILLLGLHTIVLLGCIGGGLAAVFSVEMKDVPAASDWVKKT